MGMVIYSEKQKQKITDYARANGVQSATEKYGVSGPTVYNWLKDKRFSANGGGGKGSVAMRAKNKVAKVEFSVETTEQIKHIGAMLAVLQAKMDEIAVVLNRERHTTEA